MPWSNWPRRCIRNCRSLAHVNVTVSVIKKRLQSGFLPGLVLVLILLSLSLGAARIEPLQILAILAEKLRIFLPFTYTESEEALLWSIRLPRVFCGLIVGAGLALAGAVLQGLFRNPLADPALIGVSSGAAFAAVACFVLGDVILNRVPPMLALFAVPLASFLGGFVLVHLVWRMSQQEGRTQVHTMLLAGIALNALCGAGIGVLTYLANDAQLRSITFWSLGSLGGATWSTVGVMAVCTILPGWWLLRQSRALNTLLLGEAEAGHLGVNVEKVKRQIILFSALIVGVSVSFVGMIGFIGLVTPHLIRLWQGPDYRRLLPAAALLGASLLMASDLVARLCVIPAELPIGVVTALMGAPFFLWILKRERTRL